MSMHVEVSMYGFPHAAGPELDRLAKGPAGHEIGRMEAALLSGFAAAEAKVHVISGYLKSTLHPSSSFSGDVWEGKMSAARVPGIFELARGNRPTKYHPYPGNHYFFSAGPEFERAVRQSVWEWVTGGETPAPSEGLGWKSGGDG
jgi:hypothetical protein